jgi:hypothetical protein
MKVIMTFVPISILLLLGLLITLRSGLEGLGSWERGRRLLACNVSSLIVRLFGIVAGLLLLHKLIGNPVLMKW